jgi:hypothetical protein
MITEEQVLFMQPFDDEILDLIETQLRNDEDSYTQSDLQGRAGAIVLGILDAAARRKPSKDAMRRFQEELNLQMGGSQDYTAELSFATLLHEDERCWIILYEDSTRVLDVVYKDPGRRMESQELS